MVKNTLLISTLDTGEQKLNFLQNLQKIKIANFAKTALRWLKTLKRAKKISPPQKHPKEMKFFAKFCKKFFAKNFLHKKFCKYCKIFLQKILQNFCKILQKSRPPKAVDPLQIVRLKKS